MSIYRGVNGVNREITGQHRGLSGVNREIQEQYRGVGGINRLVFSANNVLSFHPMQFNIGNNDVNSVKVASNYSQVEFRAACPSTYDATGVAGVSIKFKKPFAGSLLDFSVTAWLYSWGDSSSIYTSDEVQIGCRYKGGKSYSIGGISATKTSATKSYTRKAVSVALIDEIMITWHHDGGRGCGVSGDIKNNAIVVCGKAIDFSKAPWGATIKADS